MNKILPAVLLLWPLSLSFAQITVTNATFPTANDTLRYATDNAPTAALTTVLYTPPGGNQVWDLTTVKPGTTIEVIFKNASTGGNVASFSGAELVSITTTNETYYNVTTSRFENMGYAGNDQLGINLNIVSKLQPALPERYAPMNFFDIKQATSSVNLPIATKDLPDAFKSNLPSSVDSLRFRLSTQRLDVVDGWGVVKLTNAQYNVLRNKRTEYQTTAIDAHVNLIAPLGGWFDISTLLGNSSVPFLTNLIGTDTTVSYLYFSNTVKEIIAQATLNNEQNAFTSIRIKAPPRATTPTADVITQKPSIIAYPNPATEGVRFDYVNTLQEDFDLNIWDASGRLVLIKKHINRAPFSTISVDLKSFNKGLYLYGLVNQSGQVVEVRKLVVH